MSTTDSPTTGTKSTGTLGQKIDALLNPLYEESEQHRRHIELGRAKIAELEAGVAESLKSLEQIESRMVAVLRSLASDEPILAAALGTSPAQTSAATPAPAAAPKVSTPPAPVAQAAPAPAPVPAAVKSVASPPTADDEDPMVAQVAALLAEAEKAYAKPAPAAPAPPANLSDAAARAQAAAEKLKQQTAAPPRPGA